MKQLLLNNLKSVIGWKTRRRIVVFCVDDYGNVRVDSARSRENMNNSGLKAHKRFDAYDSLETMQDLEMLFETLSSVKDKNGDPALFTAFALPANINFEKMQQENYEEYSYELLPETFRKLSALYPSAYEGTWDLWKSGIREKLIHPEFHGREHFNLKVFNEKLAKKDNELITALKHRSLSSISESGYPNISYTAAFEFEDFSENVNFEGIIRDGLIAFENVFGQKAVHFNAPRGREHRIIHKYLHEGGIKFIDTPIFKKEHQGNGKYKTIFNYTGKRNTLGQVYLVRNCVFEPTHNRGFDWVNYTFRQVETAFRWHRPAIISSHRVNFCGHIDPENRKKGINALKELLIKIITKYPDVEFMSSNNLMKYISEESS